jgi:hypothetical protein
LTTDCAKNAFWLLELYCPSSDHRNDEMLGKTLVVAIFIAILASLGSALVFLIKDRGGSTRTAKALTVRIGISIGLFASLFVLWWLGFITPHGI